MTKSRINNADGREPSVNNIDYDAQEAPQKIKSGAVQQRNASDQQGKAALAGEEEEPAPILPFDKCELC